MKYYDSNLQRLCNDSLTAAKKYSHHKTQDMSDCPSLKGSFSNTLERHLVAILQSNMNIGKRLGCWCQESHTEENNGKKQRNTTKYSKIQQYSIIVPYTTSSAVQLFESGYNFVIVTILQRRNVRYEYYESNIFATWAGVHQGLSELNWKQSNKV